MPEFEIAPGKFIGNDHPCFFIAEIGQNHQGSFDIAKQLIDEAYKAGADCVKLQKTSLKDKFSEYALKMPYNSEHSWGKTYGEHKSYLEFSEKEFSELKSYAEAKNLIFTASAKDLVSLKFLVSLNVPFIKIGSGDANDFFLLNEAIVSQKPLVISTGMQTMNDVRQTYETVKNSHLNFALLHCVSSYPTEPSEANLRVIQTFQNEFFDVTIGYSGHERGISISIAAATLGAKIIERHITLDKNQRGNDHQCSLLPEEFKQMVNNIKIIEMALGSPLKQFLPCERSCFKKLGKTIVASKKISTGERITEKNIIAKVDCSRGLPAKDFITIIGMTAQRDIVTDEPIKLPDLIK